MTQVPRLIRRRLVLGAGATLAALAAGGSAVALAAPAAHHGHATTKSAEAGRHHTATMRNRSRGGSGMSIKGVPWGMADGQSVNLYTLRGAGGMRVNISNYGGVVQSIWVRNRRGGLNDVALGFPTLADYVADFTQGYTGTPYPISGGSGDTYFGSIVGRYANRIAKGTFKLNGQTYKLDINNGVNSLHGGYLGWNTRVWTATTEHRANAVALKLTHTFPAGEGCAPSLTPGCTGFPAAISATVTYTLTRNDQLKISYAATNLSSSQATVINLTNHTYFNLGGQASGTVYDQNLALNSNQYTPTDATQIPASPYFVPVHGTPYDFRSMHTIGKYIRDANLPDGTSGSIRQLQLAHGYDNNWVLNGQGRYRLAAVAQDPLNGVTLRAYTDQPGIQVYTGNYLVGDLRGTTGTTYRQSDAFTLETQHYPDAPNHIGQPGWPSTVLSPGATFTSRTAFKFGITGTGFASKVHFR